MVLLFMSARSCNAEEDSHPDKPADISAVGSSRGSAERSALEQLSGDSADAQVEPDQVERPADSDQHGGETSVSGRATELSPDPGSSCADHGVPPGDIWCFVPRVRRHGECNSCMALTVLAWGVGTHRWAAWLREEPFSLDGFSRLWMGSEAAISRLFSAVAARTLGNGPGFCMALLWCSIRTGYGGNTTENLRVGSGMPCLW